MRTKIRHHDSDTLARHTPRAAPAARRGPRRRQLIASPAPGAAPRAPGRAEQRLRPGRRVHAG